MTLSSSHISQGDEDGYEDTPSGEALAEGTPTADIPGPSLTTSTTRNAGHPSPAPKVRGDTGEACG